MNQNAQNLMTRKLLTVPMDATASFALTLMNNNNIRHLPVVGFGDEVVGLVSKQDLLGTDLPVKTYMTTDVETMPKNATLQQVILKMLEKKISSILIVDTAKIVVGIITTDDLLWHLAGILDKDSMKTRTIWDYFTMQTVGDIAQSLANIGI